MDCGYAQATLKRPGTPRPEELDGLCRQGQEHALAKNKTTHVSHHVYTKVLSDASVLCEDLNRIKLTYTAIMILIVAIKHVTKRGYL